MAKERKPVEYIDGVSRGLWASVLIKSIRMGWPEGCRQAEARVGRKYASYAAIVQIFEDIYPAASEIIDVMYEAQTCDWEALCKRETHAGKHLTTPLFNEWHDRWKEAWKMEKPQFLRMAQEELHLEYISKRMEENLYEWWKFKDRIQPGVMRSIDEAPWTGIPIDMADVHTKEGCDSKRFHTILSGSEPGLKMLEQAVIAKGWESVRADIHSKPVIKTEERHITSTPFPEPQPQKQQVKFKFQQMTLACW